MLFAVLTKRANQGELMISLPVRPSFIAKLHSENRDQVNNQITLHPNVPIHSFFCCALILQYPYWKGKAAAYRIHYDKKNS